MKKAKKYSVDWDNTKLYKSDDDPQMGKDRKYAVRVNKNFVKKWKKNKKYMTDPNVLFEALKDFEKIQTGRASAEIEEYYWYRQMQTNSTDETVNRKYNEIVSFTEELQDLSRFFLLNVSKIKPKYQKKMLNSKQLGEYHFFLQKWFRRRKYRLSEKEEKVISKFKRSSYENWVNMTKKLFFGEELTVIDEKYKKITVPVTEVSRYVRSQDPKVRRKAAKEYYKHAEKIAKVSIEEVNSVFLTFKVGDELKGYERPDSKRLVYDSIDEKFVDTLVEAVDGFNELSLRYYRLIADLHGKKVINDYDLNVEIIPVEGKFKYEDSIDLLIKEFSKLNSDYGKYIKSFTKGRIDVYPKKGKRGGAVTFSGNDIVKPFILMNYVDDATSIRTLSHELGHGINFEMYNKVQNMLNRGIFLATAEVASTFFESVMMNSLIENANSNKQKLALKLSDAGDFVSSVFVQIALYQIETKWHRIFRENSYISEEELSHVYREGFERLRGKSVRSSEGSDRTWVARPHFRLHGKGFYVYSYASGLLMSRALHKMLRDDPKYIEKVNLFLESGASRSPSDLMSEMGIDVYEKEFWQMGMREFEKEVDEIEVLAKKLKLI